MSGEDEQIKVIGAGFGRTGTDSLREALCELGYKCYHMHELHKHGGPPHFDDEILHSILFDNPETYGTCLFSFSFFLCVKKK